jgi:hypothetical protein
VQTAFGMPPMPICRQAPSWTSGAMNAATFRSTSVGAGFASSVSGASLLSMTWSTSLTWMDSSRPKTYGIVALVSTTIFVARSVIAFEYPMAPPKLK